MVPEATVTTPPDTAMNAVKNGSLPLASAPLFLAAKMVPKSEIKDLAQGTASDLPMLPGPVEGPTSVPIPAPLLPASGPDPALPLPEFLPPDFAAGPRSSKDLPQRVSFADANPAVIGNDSVVRERATQPGTSRSEPMSPTAMLPSIGLAGEVRLPLSENAAQVPTILQQIVGNHPELPVTRSMLRSAIETALRGQMAPLSLTDVPSAETVTVGMPHQPVASDLLGRLAEDPAANGLPLSSGGLAIASVVDWISSLPIATVPDPVSAEAELSLVPIRPYPVLLPEAVVPSGPFAPAFAGAGAALPVMPGLSFPLVVPITAGTSAPWAHDGGNLDLDLPPTNKGDGVVEEVPLPKRSPIPGGENANSAKSLPAPLEVASLEVAVDLPVNSAESEGWDLPISQYAGLAMPHAPMSQAAAATSVSHLAARMAEALVHRPNGATEFALAPEELGRVQFTVHTDAQNPDRVILYLSFDRPETMDLFRRHADQLAEAMRSAGFSGADIGFGSSARGGDTGQSADHGQIGNGASAQPSGSDDGVHVLDGKPRPTDRLSALGSGLDLRL
jgi:hypothetical protein